MRPGLFDKPIHQSSGLEIRVKGLVEGRCRSVTSFMAAGGFDHSLTAAAEHLGLFRKAMP